MALSFKKIYPDKIYIRYVSWLSHTLTHSTPAPEGESTLCLQRQQTCKSAWPQTSSRPQTTHTVPVLLLKNHDPYLPGASFL